MSSVALSKLVEKLDLKNVTPEVDISHIRITTPEINRPALQLAGYFAHFAYERVQVVGYVEYTYLENESREKKLAIYEQFLSYKIPCMVYTTKTKPDDDILRMAAGEGHPGVYHYQSYFPVYGGSDPLAERRAGTLHFHSRSAGRCVW